jgi:hypothetical protein
VVAVWSEIPVLGAILLLADLVAAAGAALVLGGQRRLGARMVVAGSIAFVPLGLIAVFGARQGPPSAIRKHPLALRLRPLRAYARGEREGEARTYSDPWLT